MLLKAAGADFRSKMVADLDFDQVLRLAEFHGLLPLVLEQIDKTPVSLPLEVLQKFEEACQHFAVQNLALAAELLRVTTEFERCGIDYLAYKGPLLASELYGNLALRVCGDLDLVVRKSQVERACEVLLGIGYSDKNDLSGGQRSAVFRYGFEHSFRNAAGLEIDLHWRIVPAFVSPSLNEGAIWSRATTRPLCGRSIQTFSPEDLFFVLCLHAGQHEWVQLSMFADLHRLLQTYQELRWDIILQHLADANTERTILVTLHILNAFWETQLPEQLRNRVAADPQVQRIAHQIVTNSWTTMELSGSRSSLTWMLERTANEPAGSRLRYVAGVALNPTEIDYVTFKLPRRFSFLYPFLRTIRLTLKRARRFATQSSNG